MEPFLQLAPHSLAIVLSRRAPADSRGVTESAEPPRHHTGYEVFAEFKALNTEHFWNKMVADAIAETFFLGWLDEHVLLIQGKEEHLEALREAWTRRSLKAPRGFDIKYLGNTSATPPCTCMHTALSLTHIAGRISLTLRRVCVCVCECVCVC